MHDHFVVPHLMNVLLRNAEYIRELILICFCVILLSYKIQIEDKENVICSSSYEHQRKFSFGALLLK